MDVFGCNVSSERRVRRILMKTVKVSLISTFHHRVLLLCYCSNLINEAAAEMLLQSQKEYLGSLKFVVSAVA